MEGHHLQPIAISTYHQNKPSTNQYACLPARAVIYSFVQFVLFFSWTHCRLTVQTVLPLNPYMPSMHAQDFGHVRCTSAKSTNNLSQGYLLHQDMTNQRRNGLFIYLFLFLESLFIHPLLDMKEAHSLFPLCSGLEKEVMRFFFIFMNSAYQCFFPNQSKLHFQKTVMR